MFRRSVSFAVSAVLAGSVAVGFGLFSPDTASALVTPAPLPVNISSLLDAASSSLGPARSAALAGSSEVVVTGGASLVNPAGAALGAAVLGFSVGSAGVQLYSTVTGNDLNSTVCSGGAFLGALYGQNCSAYLASQSNVLPLPSQNNDTTAGLSSQPVCAPDGSGYPATFCVTLSNRSDGYIYFVSTGGGFDYSPTMQIRYGETGGTAIQYGALSRVGGYNAALGGVYTYRAPDSQPSLPMVCIGFGGCTDVATSSTSPVVTSSANPSRALRTTVTGSDGAEYSCSSAPFTESDAVLPAVCLPSVPSGVTPDRVDVDETSPGAPTKRLLRSVPSDAYDNASDLYPLCVAGGCFLQVEVGGELCSVGSGPCADWFNAYRANPTSYRCLWGPSSDPDLYSLPMSECNVLAPYYRPSAQSAGTPYASPRDGTVPQGQTTGPEPVAAVPSSIGLDCFGNVYGSFDPLGWVTRPVQCALEWAFVPRQSVLEAQAQSVSASWSGTAPVVLTTAVTGFIADLPSGSGCSGILVEFPSVLGVSAVSTRVLDSCSQPMSTYASIARLILDISIGLWTILTLTRLAGGTIAFPGLGSRSAE